MANLQRTSPGELQSFDETAAVGSPAPSFAVDQSTPFNALAALGQDVGDQFRTLANESAARAGALAGLSDGQAAGAGYLQRQATVAAASGRASGLSPDLAATVDAAAAKYGVSGSTLGMIAGIESGGNAAAKNATTGAAGLFQLMPGTATQYGVTDPTDPAQSADAAAQLLRDNTSTLRQALGRDPTPAELYLAHQQGGAGAAKLLANPDAKAADLVGADAVTGNGGTADMTARQFSNIWLQKAADTSSPAGAAPAPDVLTTAMPPGPEVPQLPTQPLALRRDGTVYGNAFDDAAITAYSWRTQAALTNAVGQAYEQNQNDPAAYETAIGKVHDDFLKDSNLADPEVREAFEKTFADQTLGDRMKVQDLQAQRLRGEQSDAVQSGIEATQASLSRQAYNFGGNSAGDPILAAQSQRAQNAIDAAVTSGALTPEQAVASKANLAKSIAFSRAQGVFDALPTPDAKSQFANGLLADWSQGKGPLQALPFADVKTISDTLYSQAGQAVTAQNAQVKAQTAQVKQAIEDDVSTMASTGQGIDPAKSGLDPSTVGLLLGNDGLQAWQARRDQARQVFQATAGMATQSPEEIQDRLALMQPKPDAPGFEKLQATYAAAKAQADEVIKQRTTDPLGLAQQGSIVQLQPIDTTNPQTLEQSLERRRGDALAVAGALGTPLTFLRPAERAALTQGLVEHPALLPGFALGVRQIFGSDAPQVLGEISDDGQTGAMLAQAAGITLATGDASVPADLANAIAARGDKTLKLKMDKDVDMTAAAGRVLGGALSQAPAQQSAVLGVAQALYEQQARAQGFAPGDLTPTSTRAAAPAAVSAYATAVNRALGARTINGEQYGGIAEVNGRNTIAPADMLATAPAQLLGNLSDDNLAKLAPIKSGNGIRVTADRVRGGYLVPIGNAQYRVALGDPDGFSPQYVTGADGNFWTLDLHQLQALQAATQTTAAAPLGPTLWRGK